MKKKTLMFLCLLLVLAMVLFLFACNGDGLSVVSVTKISTEGLIDTYQIEFSDGTKASFTVTNGEQGDTGVAGQDANAPIVSINEDGYWVINGTVTDIVAQGIGISGKSAYEIYVETYGYEGTETQWLQDMAEGKLGEVTYYTVTFDINGGYAQPEFEEIQSVLANSTLELITPQKEGYEFAGWYPGETVNDGKFTNLTKVTTDLTLVAKWTEKQIMDVRFQSKSFVYSGYEYELTVDRLPEDATIVYANNKGTTAGTYAATATVSLEGYSDLVLEATLVIEKATAAIDGNTIQSYTYDGNEKQLAVMLNHEEAVLTNNIPKTNAGVYAITISAEETANYTAVSKVFQLTIEKAETTILASGIQTFVYDTTPKTVVAQLNNSEGTLNAIASYTNANTYIVSVTANESANYKAASTTVTQIIEKAITIIDAVPVQTFSYDGQPKQCTVSASNGAEVIGNHTYTNAGSYIISLEVAETDNYTSATKTINLIIDKAVATITADSEQSFVYSGSSIIIDAALNHNETFISYPSSLISAGQYTVFLSAEATQNYLSVQKTVSVTIEKGQPILYGNRTQVFTYDGEEKTVNATANHFEMAITGYTYHSLPGTYEMTISVAESANYHAGSEVFYLQINKAQLQISADTNQETTYTGTPQTVVAGVDTTKAQLAELTSYTNAGSYQITVGIADNSCYYAENIVVSFVINKAATIITAEPSYEFEYNKTARIPSATINHTETTITTQEICLNAGTYETKLISAETANYLSAEQAVTIIITKATPLLSLNTAIVNYTGNAANLYGISSSGAEVVISYSGGAIMPSDIGVYTIDLYCAGDSNYYEANDTAALEIMSQGAGTLEDPIMIYLVEDLINIGNALDLYYELGSDIDVRGAEWTPIGDATTPFSGNLDGNGFTVKNYNITVQREYNGLFGYVTGEISNLHITGAVINISSNTSDPQNVGALIGCAENSTIRNINVSSNITVTGNNSSRPYIGGIIGAVKDITIELAVFQGSILTTSAYVNVGGIIGDTWLSVSGTVMTNCVSHGTLTGNPYGNQICAGGLVGGAKLASINQCASTMSIFVENSSSYIFIGGLLGEINGCTVTNSFASGNIHGASTYSSVFAGGFIGQITGISSTVVSCYSTGDVLSYIWSNTSGVQTSMSVLAGGFVAKIEGSNAVGLSDCYATGETKAVITNNGHKHVYESSGTAVVSYASSGGFIGANYNSNLSINNCYATGNVEGYSQANNSYRGTASWWYAADAYLHTGGFIGENRGSGSISYSFCTGNVVGNLGVSVAKGHARIFPHIGMFFGLNEGSVISTYIIDTAVYTGNSAANTVATQTLVTDTFDTQEFYTNTLGWSELVWDCDYLNIEQGYYPVLINVID